jgi:hypothetical protein
MSGAVCRNTRAVNRRAAPPSWWRVSGYVMAAHLHACAAPVSPWRAAGMLQAPSLTVCAVGRARHRRSPCESTRSLAFPKENRDPHGALAIFSGRQHQGQAACPIPLRILGMMDAVSKKHEHSWAGHTRRAHTRRAHTRAQGEVGSCQVLLLRLVLGSGAGGLYARAAGRCGSTMAPWPGVALQRGVHDGGLPVSLRERRTEGVACHAWEHALSCTVLARDRVCDLR